MKIDFDQIRELLAVVSQTDITELTIESGDQKITVKKAAPAVSPTAGDIPSLTIGAPILPPLSLPAPAPQAQAETPEEKAEPGLSNGLIPITSPMVGTFYRAPSPSAPSFVELGDFVNVGQTVCIIEAMKLMNDLPSEVSGRIVRVCVDSGTTVEYGQPLFLVDPKG